MSNLEKGIRLVSDGTPEGTHVIDLNTGNEIPRIKSVCVDIEANGPVVAVLEVYVDELDMSIPKKLEVTRVQRIDNIEDAKEQWLLFLSDPDEAV